MTSEQISAFQAGSSAKPADFNLLFLGLLCAGLFLWAGWVVVSAYRAFASGRMTLTQLGGVLARTVLLLLISFWLALQ
ncbi:TIGR03758 family integrating conjugative element protein [Salmonella enterica subsp. enterica]|nr:TIGR03758 family integrating conjugative element protein [Salmonella enterica subsp. enterica]MIF51114.1 TIGR03758 family integrating conjugative element protein [Salmonella enterica subsp. enterica]